jgi:hypothetical protein
MELSYQLQAMFICYPTIYHMTMLALVSYMKIMIEWKYPVYPDSILYMEVSCRRWTRGYKRQLRWNYRVVDVDPAQTITYVYPTPAAQTRAIVMCVHVLLGKNTKCQMAFISEEQYALIYIAKYGIV